ncbi:FKBP-type peptidyl-prolyl cis-trans isomerase N-terminal domain-containing protein [Paraferrimonas haliotis]|uniref:Peptidyl-prolyl cis-trans isomerase n=1 Tax=Paraferrimonas haliotis TaxID=2013866 RepID=A0AA37TPD5_9GAMM|nr:FKBP-type peptidyl-prolyl cis-trans isomerase N-terminal domain-containing protein [Paraferrimonas haliotis]GLS82231.1 peptidyl-prolyl cis-trans isomerase [Paraferrimonas haliotis]
MIKFKFSSIAIATVLTFSASAFAKQPVTDLEKQSYSLGASIGKSVSHQVYSQVGIGADVDVDFIVSGFVDALKQQTSLSNEEIIDYLNQRSEQLNLLAKKRHEEVLAQAKQQGEQLLAENKKNSNVVVTDSGLQYEVIKLGDGEKPAPEDIVTLRYRGELADGTVFEDTMDSETPNHFPILQAFEGWNEGLQLMPVGSTFRFVVPSELAFGENGIRGIPGNSVLVMNVELLAKEKPSDNSQGMGLNRVGMGGMMGH